MRLFIAAVLAMGFAASANASPAAPRMPAQKAFDAVHEAPAQACMNGAYVSHTAFTAALDRPLRCSEFLSTDTLMKTRRWDRT